jgi:rhodanese-related sulfurtransferase
MRGISRFALFLVPLLILGVSGCTASAKQVSAENVPRSQDVPRMQIDELRAHLGDPGYVVIDVRQAGDWEASSAKIKGAIREEYNGVSKWAYNYPKDKTIVLYCA